MITRHFGRGKNRRWPFDSPIDMKTSFVGVINISFLSDVHMSDGKKVFHKELRKQKKYLCKCGLIKVDEYLEVVIEEEVYHLLLKRLSKIFAVLK